MEKIIVGIAEGKIALENQILISYALGSCVGICLYDWKNHIAGMAHIILPGRNNSINQKNAYKFADDGLRALIDEMESRGAEHRKITAKIAGGARMFQTQGARWEIGEQNVKAVKDALNQEHIRVVAEDTGKNYGRTVTFYASDGRVEVTSMKHQMKIL